MLINVGVVVRSTNLISLGLWFVKIFILFILPSASQLVSAVMVSWTIVRLAFFVGVYLVIVSIKKASTINMIGGRKGKLVQIVFPHINQLLLILMANSLYYEICLNNIEYWCQIGIPSIRNFGLLLFVKVHSLMECDNLHRD